MSWCSIERYDLGARRRAPHGVRGHRLRGMGCVEAWRLVLVAKGLLMEVTLHGVGGDVGQ